MIEDALKRYAELRAQYEDCTDDINYPGKPFYQSFSIISIVELTPNYYDAAPPFVLRFTKNGNSQWEFPISVGTGDSVINAIEEQKDAKIEVLKQKSKTAKERLETWIITHPIHKGESLNYYINTLRASYDVLLDNQAVVQIAAQVDLPLKEKLKNAFKHSTLTEEEVYSLCVPDEKAEVTRHADMLTALEEWCCREGVSIQTMPYEQSLRHPEFIEKLQACYDRGYFLYTSYSGVTWWTLEDEYGELKSHNNNPVKAHERSTVSLESLPLLTDEQRLWINASKFFAHLRDQRKTMQQKMYYYQAKLLQEIGTRIGIALSELEHAFVSQIVEHAQSDPHKLQDCINGQKKGHLVYWTPETGILEEQGEKAEQLFQTYRRSYHSITQLTGTVACKGKATGVVRIIIDTTNVKEFNDRDILVTGMTAPNFVPLMKKSGAIITDLGGMTCHAAIISRELGKPCIIGTKIATKVLKDGDMVEVDAHKGIVIIKK